MQKVGRNDPCPCGSGKKFKKCCEEKVARKKFNAHLISGGEENKAQKIGTSFFQRLAPPPQPSQETPENKDVIM